MKRNNFEKYDSEYKIKKDWLFPFSQIEAGSQIVLYGAGDVGQAYHRQLEETKFGNVCLWVDKEYECLQKWNLDVNNPNKIRNTDFDYVVIAVFDMHKARSINDYLLGIGVDQEKIIWNGQVRVLKKGDYLEQRLVIPVIEQTKEYLQRRNIDPNGDFGKKLIDKNKEKAIQDNALVIPRIVFELTRACSLRCVHCNNLMNKYINPEHVKLESVLNDLKAISEASDGIITLELIGGEPFVYPWISEVINMALKIDNIWEIEITTNGTIIPKEEVINALCDKKITVRISRYEASRKIDELEKLLFSKGVRFEEITELQWIDSGDTDPRGRSAEELKDIFMLCPSSYYCKTVLEGRIFTCARAASMYDLGVYRDTSSYVEIMGNPQLKSDLKKFMLKLSDNSCDRCDVTDSWREIKAGEQ